MYILSDFIRDGNFTMPEKMTYMVLWSYREQNSLICNVTCKQIAHDMTTSTKTAYRLLDSLAKKKLIKINKLNVYEIKKELEAKNMQGKGIGSNTCTWCKCKTYILHAHHFPIRKEAGGNVTVDICPSCHQEFHFLENSIELVDSGYIADKLT